MIPSIRLIPSWRLPWILAVLLCVAGTVAIGQEIVIEQAESDFLESVQGADGMSLDGYAGPLLLTGVNQTNVAAGADGPEDLVTLVTGRIVSLAPTPDARTGPALVIIGDVQGLLITWPAEARGFLLEFTSDLGNPASWQPVLPAPEGNDIRPSPGGTARFYRLRSQ